MTGSLLTTFYIIVGAYLVLVCGIGLYNYRRASTEEGFLAAGRSLGLGLAASPYEISAIYSMQSRRATRMAIGYSFFFQACVGIGVLLFGLAMRVAMPYLPQADLATPVLGMSVLPPAVGLLVLLAAVVTLTRTGGAILLMVASAVSHDMRALATFFGSASPDRGAAEVAGA